MLKVQRNLYDSLKEPAGYTVIFLSMPPRTSAVDAIFPHSSD